MVPRWPSWVVIATLCTGAGAVACMQFMMIPFIPDLPSILGIPVEDASWLITATLMTNVVAAPSVSKLADMFGKRKILIITISVMIFGSLLGGMTEAFPVLIVARVLQGFGIAVLPIGISIMRDELPREKLAAGVAIMSGALGIGWGIGLPLGGMLSAFLTWHSVFWVSMAMGVVILFAVLIVIPESPIRSGGKFDFLGAGLLSVVLTALLLIITKGNSWGWTSRETLWTFVILLAMFPIWIKWELSRNEPLVDIRANRQRTVLLTNIAAYCVGFSIYINMLGTMVLLQEPSLNGYGLDLTELQAGIAMIPIALAMPMVAPVSVQLMHKIGARKTLIMGTGVMAFGYCSHLLFLNTTWQIIASGVLVSAGTAIAYAPMPVLIMGAVPLEETAAANGVNAVMRSIGTSSASATVAAILAGVTVMIGSEKFTRIDAFVFLFAVALLAALIATLSAAYLPKIFSSNSLLELQRQDGKS